MNPTTSRTRRGFVWLAAGAAALGIGVGAAGLASAASSSSTDGSATVVTVDSSTSQSSTDQSNTALTPPADQPQLDPASLPNGPGETLLTGDTLTKVTAAAEAAEPGATVIRAETDSSGHAYEVHVQLSDGSYETLYFDESFVADGSDTGFGPAPQGQHPMGGQPPAGMPGQAPADGANGSTDTTVAG